LDIRPVTPGSDPGEGLFEGGGEMGAQFRSADWAGSALGSLDAWPSALRTAVDLALSSEAAAFVTWGDDDAVFFNDSLNGLLDPGEAHPLGRPAREVLGALWTALAPHVHQARAGDAVQAVLPLPAAEGKDEGPFAVAISPLRDDTGETGTFGICIEMGRAMKARIAGGEEALRQAEAGRRKAEDESRAKDEFIAVVSHELRAPLGSILIWSQLLRGDAPDVATLTRALGMIERSTRSLARLIDDLLDASRVIAGKLQVEKAPVDLKPAVEAAVESERMNAAAKNIGLELVLEAPAARVMGDARRLQQVIVNLLSNAIKFTPEGGRVEVRLVRTSSSAQIEVSDTGIGIRSEYLPVIFDRFRQVNPERPQTGLGLGLSIARHLVELHGGRIAAASPGMGQGSTFVVTLPLLLTADEMDRPAAAPPPETGRRTLEGLTILLVDDEQDAREAVAVLLRQAGAGVRAVGSAAEALAAVQQDGFDIVLSDIAMPIEDGYVLISKLREHPRTARIPALALTAYATVEDRGKALRAGYNQHMAKPVDPAHLVSVVATLARASVRRG
jgi:signal transduction histidine kinase/ActR/RegA family two-component response regulator